MRVTAARLVLLGVLAGCRGDPGEADYSSHAGLRERAAGPEFLPGPDPYVPGTERWNLGAFYESQASVTVPIDGAGTNYFIFDTAGDGSGILTYVQESATDRVEGTMSDRIIHAGEGFAGGGIFWNAARDISGVEALHVSLKSSDGAFATIQINVDSGADLVDPANPPPLTTAVVTANAYGYSNDGEWHTIAIPLADLEAQGFDPTSCRSPFYFDVGGGGSGETLLVDNLYLE